MSRLKLMTMNRFKSLLFTPFAVAAAVLLCGIGVTSAETVSNAAQHKPLSPHAIRNPKVDPNLSPAQRARAQRAVAIKQRQESKKFIQDVVEGKQPAASATTDKGVAK